ncbi:hypothetical protein [Evansella vedderi]|nr:hypothetical protein [Evansella vedderi]
MGVYVAYSLKDDRYELKFDGKTVHVEKYKWNNFIRKQHNDNKDVISLGGDLSVEPEELERLISK